MHILVNRNIKHLFCVVLAAAGAFTLLSTALAAFCPEHGALYVLVSCAAMGVSVLAALYRYFRNQHKHIETAAGQIRDYLSGNRTVGIECDEEGELYRIFHEVNSLVSILNAHGENESRARQFMKDTISDISHQLKTPLAALNVYNGIIRDEAEDASIVRDFSDLSEQELDRIETLVQNLLKLTKLDAGTMVMEKKVENIAKLMSRLEAGFSHQAKREEKNLSFSGSDTVRLCCDGGWLTEAVSNLVKNAFDHTEVGDSITVEWRKFASILQIIVRDSGSGIHPEDLPHIFKRFYRSRFSKDKQGIGLGLPLTKAIVQAHNGTIEVDSELGAGTTFTINIPIPTEL